MDGTTPPAATEAAPDTALAGRISLSEALRRLGYRPGSQKLIHELARLAAVKIEFVRGWQRRATISETDFTQIARADELRRAMGQGRRRGPRGPRSLTLVASAPEAAPPAESAA